MTNKTKLMEQNETGETLTPENDVLAEVLNEETQEVEEAAVKEDLLEEEVTTEPESAEDLKKKIQTLEAQKNHYREKASKREALETSTSASMSPADLVAVMNAGVHQDDMERVERFAISEGVSIRDAVKNPELQAILDVRSEQRNTAVATNVENVRRGNAKASAESLLNRANKGDIPTNDDEIEALVAARSNRKN